MIGCDDGARLACIIAGWVDDAFIANHQLASFFLSTSSTSFLFISLFLFLFLATKDMVL